VKIFPSPPVDHQHHGPCRQRTDRRNGNQSGTGNDGSTIDHHAGALPIVPRIACETPWTEKQASFPSYRGFGEQFGCSLRVAGIHRYSVRLLEGGQGWAVCDIDAREVDRAARDPQRRANADQEAFRTQVGRPSALPFGSGTARSALPGRRL
jgi:hypothetical protein